MSAKTHHGGGQCRKRGSASLCPRVLSTGLTPWRGLCPQPWRGYTTESFAGEEGTVWRDCHSEEGKLRARGAVQTCLREVSAPAELCALQFRRMWLDVEVGNMGG